jgi:ligand-binding sensor domain-containing protein
MVDFVQDVWDAGENGLPHPGVTSIRQTRDGYLWIATFAGVVRFDGMTFQPPDVADPKVRTALLDHVRSILEADDGAMWFSTRREGVIRVKDGQAQIFTAKDGLPSGDVRQMVQTKDGTIWMATGSGLCARDRAGKLRTYGTDDGIPHLNIVALYLDADGTVWVGTGLFGVARFDGQRFQPVALPMPKELPAVEQAFALPLRSVGAFARDAQGVLWAGTSVGLIRVPEKGPLSADLLPGAVNVLAEGREAIWASTSAGLGRLQADGYQKYTSQEGLLNDGLMAVFEDREGSVWVGSRIGLARLRPRAIRTYGQRDGVGHDTVHCVLAMRNGDVWVGHRNGISRFRDGGWSSFGMADGLPNPEIRTLAEGPDGALWIGTLDGLARFDGRKMTAYRGLADDNYSVRSIVFDTRGRLWIVGEGLDRLEDGKIVRVKRRAELCDTSNVNYVHLMKDGSLLTGTNSGMMRIGEDGASRCFKEKEVLSRNDVRNIYEDAGGTVWIGSIGGISRLAGDGRDNLAGTAGPFNTAVYALLDDGLGGFWASTPKGLFRIEKGKIEQRSDASSLLSIYRSFGTADGMDTPVGTGGGQPTAARSPDGRLWFATATGVAMVDPANLEVDTTLPPVYVERLLADRRPMDLRDPRLAPGSRDVELHFALLSFVAPEQQHYKYRLVGYDRDWIESGGRRVAYYSNLAPRLYRFEVLAANHNGVWSDKPAQIEFELLPRFYQRSWFLPLVGLLLVGAGFGLHRYRTAALRAREVELQKRVDETVASLQVLRGMLPICASCRRVREDAGSWRQIEAYVMEHSEATFSHGMCPDCWEKLRQSEPNLPAYKGGN